MKLFSIYLAFLFLTACNGSSSKSQNFQNFDESILFYRIKNELPGLGTAKIIDEHIEIYTSGVKKIGTELPLLASDIFHLGSCSKAMTATLAAILIEEGVFDWSTRLVDLLTEKNIHADFKDATFEMLLSHRSGLINDGSATFPDDWLFKALQNPALSPTTARNLYAQNILSLEPQVEPGSKFIYSNGGYIIAAHIMEFLTGKSWESLIQEKLFSPLGMSSCGTGPTWGHYRHSQKIYPIYADNPPAYSPASGIHCTMTDWGKFLTQHLNGLKGRNGIVNSETFQKLHTISANDGHNYTYGGWGKVNLAWANGEVLTHNGSNTFNYAQVWIAPEKNAIYMVATNIAGTGAVNAANELLAQMQN